MGLCIALETENGETLITVTDDKNLLHRLLPAPGSSDEMIASIDWYGDTTFNRLQMKQFLYEWERVIDRASTPDEQNLLGVIKQMAQCCKEQVHTYVKFAGD